jgi:RNA polymerase sigma-70 factor (sigma-E family)
VDAGLAVPRRKGAQRVEELYDEHMAPAVRFAYLVSGDEALAQDLAHDAFLKVASKLARLRSPEAFGAYLRSAILNGCRSHWRKTQRERVRLETVAATLPPAVSLPDVGTVDEMRQALAALPPRRRVAVVLRYYEDMSERQTADVMGCSVSAVKALVGRGLEQLRAILEGDPGE